MYRYYKLISQGYLKNITVQKLELENFLNVKSSRIVINIQILKIFSHTYLLLWKTNPADTDS